MDVKYALLEEDGVEFLDNREKLLVAGDVKLQPDIESQGYAQELFTLLNTRSKELYEYQFVYTDPERTTTSLVLTPAETLTTAALEGGDYRITISYEVTNSKTNRDTLVEGEIDNFTEVFHVSDYRPVTANIYRSYGATYTATLAAGVHTIQIVYARIGSGNIAKIRRTFIDIHRVG